MIIDVRRAGEVLSIRLATRQLSAQTAPQVRQGLASLGLGDGARVIMNLSAVESIDSEGLGVLVSLAKHVGSKGKLVFCQAGDAVKTLFELTRLDQVFRLVASEEEAVAALAIRPRPVTPTQELQLLIYSSLQNVPLLGVAINSVCTSLALPAIEAYQVELCVVEAATNTIKHAYDGQPGLPVQVTVTVHSDRLVITVCDEGRVMPARTVPSLDFDPTDLEHLPEGGMGLFLIHSIMDEVSYACWHGVNVLTMTKNLPPRQEDTPC